MNEIQKQLEGMEIGETYEILGKKILLKTQWQEFALIDNIKIRLNLRGALSAIKGTIERKEHEQPMILITPTFPPELRACTIHAPHAIAICEGIKLKEYRTRKLKHTGWTLIHSGSSTDSDECLELYDIPKSKVVRKAIIGAAIVTGYEDNGYTLENSLYFPEPIKNVSGKQAVFWSAKTGSEIQAFNQAWALIEEMTK